MWTSPLAALTRLLAPWRSSESLFGKPRAKKLLHGAAKFRFRGAVQFISLNGDDAEGKYKLGPVEHTTPEVLFERSWAETVVARVAAQLREEYERAGDGARFARLKEFLMGGAEARYASTAAELGLSEGGVKTCVRRLRMRFRDLLREELGQTVEDPAEVDSEIRHLLLALAA